MKIRFMRGIHETELTKEHKTIRFLDFVLAFEFNELDKGSPMIV